MNRNQFTAWCRTFVAPALPAVHKPLIMGVLNVTPDSFSDAGLFLNLDAAVKRAEEMIAQGVDIIDVGGESSRPGAQAISCSEELDRVIPIIERLRDSHDISISIDTCKAEVMAAAVSAGASFINDINALKGDNALSVVASLDVPVCLMHMQGDPQSMQERPHYAHDIVDEINTFFAQRIAACEAVGISRERLILDPGFGFGKSVAHNLRLLQRIAEFQCHGLPILLGVSRKSTLGIATLNQSVMDRMPAGIACAVFAVLRGVTIIRTHDVAETRQALQMINAIVSADEQG